MSFVTIGFHTYTLSSNSAIELKTRHRKTGNELHGVTILMNQPSSFSKVRISTYDMTLDPHFTIETVKHKDHEC